MQEATQARAIYGHGVLCIRPPSNPRPFSPKLQLNYGGHWSHNYKLLLTSKMAIQKHNPRASKRGRWFDNKELENREKLGGIPMMCEGVKTNYIKIKLICFGPYSIILSCYYLKHSISSPSLYESFFLCIPNKELYIAVLFLVLST